MGRNCGHRECEIKTAAMEDPEVQRLLDAGPEAFKNVVEKLLLGQGTPAEQKLTALAFIKQMVIMRKIPPPLLMMLEMGDMQVVGMGELPLPADDKPKSQMGFMPDTSGKRQDN